MPTSRDDESRLEQSKMSFGEHLNELRTALFKSLLALICGFIVGLIFGQQIVDYIQTPLRESLERFYLRQAQANQQKWLEEMQAAGEEVSESFVKSADELAAAGLMPQRYFLHRGDLEAIIQQQFPGSKLPTDGAENDSANAEERAFDRQDMIPLRVFVPIEDDPRMRVIAINTQEPFAVYIRTAFLAGAIIASPFIFYFLWQFVAAGLYRQEQSYVYTYLPVSIGLFLGGALLAFFFAFRPLLDFLLRFFERMHIDPGLRLSEWISFVLLLPLAFGISFQLPLVMLLLERIGVFTVDMYWRKWRAAIVVISIIAMLLTPSPDPYAMLLMGIPLAGLYFAGIWMCKHMPGGPKQGERPHEASA